MNAPTHEQKGNNPGPSQRGPVAATTGAVGALALAAGLVAPAPSSASTLARPQQTRTVNVPFLRATTSKPYSSAVSSFKTAVSSAGMMVLGQLNQAGAISVTGLHLKGAETFFVGNPTVGKKLFQVDPAVGAVIPLRMYVFADKAGRTEVGYLDPSKLASAVDPKLAKPAEMLAKVADKIVRSVTGQAPQAGSTARSLSFVTVASHRSFASTVSGLKTAVSSAGMMVLGQLNQAGALSVAGLHLKGAEKFFVGNPTVGKKLFAMDPAIGMEIPIGMYLWVNQSGGTEIGYFAPAPVFQAVSPMFSGEAPMFTSIAAKVAHGAA